jgi:hypothetical protein
MKTITQNVNLQKFIENLEAAFNQYIFLIHQKFVPQQFEG